VLNQSTAMISTYCIKSEGENQMIRNIEIPHENSKCG